MSHNGSVSLSSRECSGSIPLTAIYKKMENKRLMDISKLKLLQEYTEPVDDTNEEVVTKIYYNHSADDLLIEQTTRLSDESFEIDYSSVLIPRTKLMGLCLEPIRQKLDKRPS